jgi:putative modified peptide
MAQTLADKRITINATPQEVRNFLDKLASDDEFRARFAKEPAEVLAEHHLYFPIADLPADAVLPSKDTLGQALAEFTRSGTFDAVGVHSPDRWAFGLFWWLYYTTARPAMPCARSMEGQPAAAKLSDEEHAALIDRMSKLRITASITPREVFHFLLALAMDDKFRERVAKHPEEALAEHHIYLPHHDPRVHVRLPSKTDIQQILMDVMARQEMSLTFVPFNANAELSWFVSFVTFLSVRGAPKAAH